MKYVSNIEEIKIKLLKAKIPKTFSLSKSELITDVRKFIDVNLSIIDTNELVMFHRPYYNRLKTVLDKLKIKIKIEEN